MNLIVQYKCDDFRPQMEQDFARYAAKLERWLERYDSDLASLHASYEKHSRKKIYTVTLNLTLRSARLHAGASNAEARFALRHAFDELEMQLSRHMQLARKDYEWKRKRFRRAVSVGA